MGLYLYNPDSEDSFWGSLAVRSTISLVGGSFTNHSVGISVPNSLGWAEELGATGRFSKYLSVPGAIRYSAFEVILSQAMIAIYLAIKSTFST